MTVEVAESSLSLVHIIIPLAVLLFAAVVLAKSHLSPGDIADTVLGYLYESEEDQPRNLF